MRPVRTGLPRDFETVRCSSLCILEILPTLRSRVGCFDLVVSVLFLGFGSNFSVGEAELFGNLECPIGCNNGVTSLLLPFIWLSGQDDDRSSLGRSGISIFCLTFHLCYCLRSVPKVPLVIVYLPRHEPKFMNLAARLHNGQRTLEYLLLLALIPKLAY